MGEAQRRMAYVADHDREPDWARIGVKSAGDLKRWQLVVAVMFANWVSAMGHRQAMKQRKKAV